MVAILNAKAPRAPGEDPGAAYRPHADEAEAPLMSAKFDALAAKVGSPTGRLDHPAQPEGPRPRGRDEGPQEDRPAADVGEEVTTRSRRARDRTRRADARRAGRRADPQPAPTPVEPAKPAATEDITSLPEWAQKQIRDARAEAAKSRTTAKQTAADEARQETLATIAKALGIRRGRQAGRSGGADQARSSRRRPRRGAPPWSFRYTGTRPQHADALLDSLKFIDSLDELVEMDPRSPDFATALEAKVQEAVASKANGQAPVATAPRGPTLPRVPGGPDMDVDSRIAEAQKKGDWRTVISLQNQKLTTT
jgi:hypothetical protein